MHPDFQPCAYILASGYRRTVYIGVSSNLMLRISQHRDNIFDGFTAYNNIKRLVHYQAFGTMEIAITHEKRWKRWQRPWKFALIEAGNPEWRDMAEDWGFPPL